MYESEFDRQLSFGRRRFLVAAITFSGLASGLRHAQVWAQAGFEFDANTLMAMAAMARQLYPHDEIPDAVYSQVLNDALAAAADDGALAGTLLQAEEALNGQQTADFLAADANAQIQAMQAVEQTDFFTTIQSAVRGRIYSHRSVWNVLAYEGPSFQQGGYLNRGAGVVDWLPEDE